MKRLMLSAWQLSALASVVVVFTVAINLVGFGSTPAIAQKAPAKGKELPKGASALTKFAVKEKTYRPGSDFKNFPVNVGDTESCAKACLEAAQCKAFSLVKRKTDQDKDTCWLQSAVPKEISDPCCISGVKR